MSLPKNISSVKISALLLLLSASGQTMAQSTAYKNQYPCAECAVFDNNGHDLMSFINTNKRETETRGSKVNEFSDNSWGYIEVKTGKVASVNSRGERKGELNYAEPITATYVLFQSPNGAKATWWARECNQPSGPLVNTKVDDKGKLDLPNVRYAQITSELEPKAFTIVEFEDTNYNQRDYDNLLKNYILIERGIVKNVEDYKTIIQFYNGFLSKFTYTNDPLLEKRSFITLFSTNKNKYIGYFNIVNGKLAGHLEILDLQYESDKDKVINEVMRKLKGTRIYVYGDEVFDMEKSFSKYARAHGVKIRPWKTTATTKFNADK